VIFTNTFGGAFGFGPSIKHSFLGGLNGDSGWGNSILYSAPKAGGFSSSILYSAGEETGEASTAKVGGNVVYSKGKLTTTIALQSVDTIIDDNTAVIGDTQRAGLFGAKYDVGAAVLTLQLSRMATKSEANGTTDYKTVHAGITVPMGKSKYLLSYASTKTKAGSESSRKSGALGYIRTLNDKVNIYAVFYDETVSTADSNGNTLAFGGRFSF
jgi:predicted porin